MKLLRICGVIACVIMAGMIFLFKMMYYIRKGWFSGGENIAWVIISMTISMLPVIFILISFMFSDKTVSLVLLCVGGSLIGINILLEIISFFGSGMCLDGDWMAITIKMLICHVLGFFPLGLGLYRRK